MPMGCAVCGHPPYAHGCTELHRPDHEYVVPTGEQMAQRLAARRAAGPHRLPGSPAPERVAPAEVIPLTPRQRPAPAPAPAAPPATTPPQPPVTRPAAAVAPMPVAAAGPVLAARLWPGTAPPPAAARRRPACTRARRIPRWRWRHGGLTARTRRAA